MTPTAMTKDAIWKEIISEGGIHHSANALAMLNTKRLVRQVQYVLSDSGASSHFLVKGASAVNIKPATALVDIK